MRGNYDTATVLRGKTTTLLLCVAELPHSYISVCGNYHSAATLLWNYHRVTVQGNHHTATLLSRELLHSYSSVCWNKISTLLF